MGETGAERPSDYKYDLAVSFAGEQRTFVEAVVRGVNVPEGRVFYDADFQAELWGEELTEVFTDIYSKSTRYVVMFISKEYADKEWTRLERRAALAKRLSTQGAYILPVLLDTTQLDEVAGLLKSIGYLDGLMLGAPGVIDCLNKKLEKAWDAERVAYDRTPASEDEGGDDELPVFGTVVDDQEGLTKLIQERPHSWQWAAFASVMVQRRNALKAAIRDLELGYAQPNSIRISTATELRDFVGNAMNDVEQLGTQVSNLVLTDAFKAAFGEPNDLSDDPEALVHAANRLMDLYERFIELAQRAQGASAKSAYMNVLNTCARFSDSPRQGLDELIDNYVTTVHELPKRLVEARGENVIVPLELKLHMDNDLLEQAIRQLREVFEDEES
ncbi:TIR domain-containing protein [Rhodococcus sp. NPDC055112]